MLLDVADFLRVGEHATKQADGADSSRGATRYPSEAAGLGLHGGGGLAARDRFKESLYVRAGEVLERLFPEQRQDVASDPPAIDFKRAGFLGQALAANDEPGLGLRQVFTAQVADGYGVPFLGPPFHGIEASFDIAEKLPGLAAGLIWRQSTGLADGEASRLTLTIAKLDHE